MALSLTTSLLATQYPHEQYRKALKFILALAVAIIAFLATVIALQWALDLISGFIWSILRG